MSERNEDEVGIESGSREEHRQAAGPELQRGNSRQEAVSPSGRYRLRWTEGSVISYLVGPRMYRMGSVELADRGEIVLKLARELPCLGVVIDTGRFAVVEPRVRHFGFRVFVYERDGRLLSEWRRPGSVHSVGLSTGGRWVCCNSFGSRMVRVFDIDKGSFVPEVRTFPRAAASAEIVSDEWALLMRGPSGEVTRMVPSWHVQSRQ